MEIDDTLNPLQSDRVSRTCVLNHLSVHFVKHCMPGIDSHKASKLLLNT